jgi:hypothetical protein
MIKAGGESMQTIALNDFENKLMRFKGGISACNIIQSADKESAIAYIHERFQQITSLNPWLKGSCSKGKKGQIYLNFDSNETDASPLIFQGQAPSSINTNSNYSDILACCEQYIVEKAFKLYNKKDRLTKLVILHLDDQRFLLMFSLSHLIGDGHTFYQIFNMLSVKSEVIALDVIRKNEIEQARDFIPKTNANFIFSPRMIFWAITRAFSRKKMRIKSFELNASYVQSQKLLVKEKGKVPFVSTNDILSSTYAQLNTSNAMIMAINFRNRIPGITDEDAGNYEDLLVINKETSSKSENIRVLIGDLKTEVLKMKLPEGRAKSKSNPVLITNWAGFSQPLLIDNAKSLLHLPLYTSKEITFDSCIVYAPQEGKVSALLFMKDLSEDKVLAHPLFQKN